MLSAFLLMEQAVLPPPSLNPPLSNPSMDLPAVGHALATGTGLSSFPVAALLLRCAAVLSIAAVSLWANYEASKGFELNVVSTAAPRSRPARRFDLMFVSNGRAAQLVLNSSDGIERVLYSGGVFPRKPVKRVVLRLSDRNLTDAVEVICGEGEGVYSIFVSPSVMAETDVPMSMAAAVHRGMARVWLWDGQGTAPRRLLDAMAEYLVMRSGLASRHRRELNFSSMDRTSPCWAGTDAVGDAHFFQFCEDRRPGFVARLNGAVQERWDESMVDGALGAPAQQLCAAYVGSRSRSDM